jgi:UDP-N-acetylmuramate--alanine ligase
MSAIATVLAGMGHHVTGSDERDSATLQRLAEHGVRTWVGHRPELLGPLDAVTVSTAVPAADPEVVHARAQGTPVLRRAEMLAAICATRRTVAVAGTHGKTTTSAMLATILDAAGLRPSFIVGGDIAGIGPGARWDQGEWLVVEADESDGTFLELGAEAVIVTSVEADHLDHYGDFAGLQAAFERFLIAAPGPQVICADGSVASELARRLADSGGNPTTYGSQVAATGDHPSTGVDPSTGTPAIVIHVAGGDHLTIGHLAVGRDVDGRGRTSFELVRNGVGLGTVELAVPGYHNAQNATAALALSLALGVSFAVGSQALAGFRGVARRFERRGERDGVTYVDDYGHLPGEVSATIAAALAGGWERIVAVFQPHRYSRTATLWRDFADAFEGADVLVVTDVYPSGETPVPGITGALIADAVASAHPGQDVRYVATRPELVAALRSELRPGDLCLTLGAGDLTTLPDEMLASPR